MTNARPPKDQPNGDKTPATLAAEESDQAHQGLRAQFERIESALNGGDFHRGAQLLSELIEQAREHFINEENIALGAGLPSSAGGRMVHEALIARASSLKARCLNIPANAPANTDTRHDIEAELVVLLSDLVESDLRIAHILDTAVTRETK